MKIKNSGAIIIFIAIIVFNSCSDKVAEKPFIKPPFSHLNPEYTDFDIDAERGGFLKYETGTTIKIPENAWADAEGNNVKGKVKVSYRELHEATDIFLSGANMNYDTAGIVQNLTTAGMFEIRAYKDTSEIFIKKGTNLTVKLASYRTGEDFNFYSLNEGERNWNYKGTEKPEVNKKIVEITDTITKLQPEYTFPFDKNKFFVLSADAILDVYFRDNPNLIWKNHKSKKPKRKAEKYGLAWHNIDSDWKKVFFKRVKFEAYQIVWKNISGKKIPYWARKDSYIEKLTKISKDTFYMKLKSNEKSAYIKVKAVIPLKYLFAYPPETWQKNYDVVMKRIEEEQKRLAMQCAVFRTFNVAVTGFHNWDKVLHRKDKVLVKSDFKFDNQTDDLSDIDVYYFIDNNKSFVKINLASTDTLKLIPDSTAKFVAVLSDTKAGIFSSTDYNKIDFDKLKSYGKYTFNMKTIEVKSKEDFLNFLN